MQRHGDSDKMGWLHLHIFRADGFSRVLFGPAVWPKLRYKKSRFFKQDSTMARRPVEQVKFC